MLTPNPLQGNVVPQGVPTDNSSAYMAYGNTYRGIGSSWFNQNNIEREDFARNEQAAQNQFRRDLEQMGIANSFTASEAQKNRDFQERMARNSYRYAVEDMKAAGLNPLLAINQGGSSTPSGSSASSSSPSRSGGYRSRGRNSSDPLDILLRGLVGVVGSYVSGRISLNNQLALGVQSLDNSSMLSSQSYAQKLSLDDEWRAYHRRWKK